MSDNLEEKYSTGNFAGSPHLLGHTGTFISSMPSFHFGRRLAEECFVFTMADLRNSYKRPEILRLADTYQPVTFQFEGHRFALYLITEFLPRPRHICQTGDFTIRVWMSCPACFRRVRKVYTYSIAPGSPRLAELKCFRCHKLTYQSKNCSGNLWWSKYAMPLKRLLRRQEKLLLRKRTKRVVEKLDFVERQIFVLRQRVKPKHSTRRPSGVRRPYKNIGLILHR
jgi:hypothetical protein